ncbi:MAG: DUF4276 family protein [Microcystaceae cyanobacterium]
MNIYFLVEGNSTEKRIYPRWLSYLIPELKRVNHHDEVTHNNYYISSEKGYPALLYDPLDNAIDKIKEINRYDYLVICVDAEEETVNEKISYIQDTIQERKINLGKTKLIIIIQNRCFETWLLGNRKIFSRQPQEETLLSYISYYDVSQNDPELMGDNGMRNHANFHYEYLRRMFEAKNRSYSKKNPSDARERYYLEALQKRIEDSPKHLQTFQNFLKFCAMIKEKIT